MGRPIAGVENLRRYESGSFPRLVVLLDTGTRDREMSVMSTTSTPQLESIEGIVERITFHSDESGYTVARFKVPRTADLITIIGNFAQIEAGQTLKLSGLWRDHPKYGQQFQVTQYRETKPATLTGIEKYLGSGLIKGVGPVTAKRIVAHFSLDTLDIIENQIEGLFLSIRVQDEGSSKHSLTSVAGSSGENFCCSLYFFIRGKFAKTNT